MLIRVKEKFSRIIFGLGFGDEGKGTMIDFLADRYDHNLVVRYNSGSQPGHNVVRNDGQHHTFSQIGSAAFTPGVRTLVSRFMFWDPIALVNEVSNLAPKLSRHPLNDYYIDMNAPIINPIHVAANRIKEWLRGGSRHGSCGKGFGEAVSDRIAFPNQQITGQMMGNVGLVIRLLNELRLRKLNEILSLNVDWNSNLEPPDHIRKMISLISDHNQAEVIAETYRQIAKYFNFVSGSESISMIKNSNPIFEGGQGILLDQDFGFHPHTTWTDTRPTGAYTLLAEAHFDESCVEEVGVIRSYSTRHGAGPFVSEGCGEVIPNPWEHNKDDQWQESFRVGCFDFIMLDYALNCLGRRKGISIALTHTDIFDRMEFVPYVDSYTDSSQGIEVTGIGYLPKGLDDQAKLAQYLGKIQPGTIKAFPSLTEMIDEINKRTSCRVKYTSFGPRTDQKEVLWPR